MTFCDTALALASRIVMLLEVDPEAAGLLLVHSIADESPTFVASLISAISVTTGKTYCKCKDRACPLRQNQMRSV